MYFWCSFIGFLCVNYIACVFCYKALHKKGYILRFFISLLVAYLIGFFAWSLCGLWFLIPVPIDISDMFLTLTVICSPVFCFAYVLIKLFITTSTQNQDNKG